MDKKDLMIEALNQRIAEIVTSLERRIAELRVELTVLNDEYEAYKQRAENQDSGPDVGLDKE